MGRAALAALAVLACAACAADQRGDAVCSPAPDGEPVAIGVSFDADDAIEITDVSLVDASGIELTDVRLNNGAGAVPLTDSDGLLLGPAIGTELPAGIVSIAVVLERTAEVGTTDGLRIAYDSVVGPGFRMLVGPEITLVAADSCS